MAQYIFRFALRATQLILLVFAGAYLLYAADHARQLLFFPFPLDYGEGPLLAQVERLRVGVPIWALYADPALPPFLIINYPPLYLLLSAALTPLAGSVLTAGRLISLLATLGSVAALAVLVRRAGATPATRRVAVLLTLLLLTVPITREWSSLMRVDLLGLCAGLWGLVVLMHPPLPSVRRAALAGVLCTASLFVKPSLLAAPAAAAAWLTWQTWRASRSVPASPGLLAPLFSLIFSMGLIGGLSFGMLQWASEGWFALHVVAANANRWEATLARDFWLQQLELRWALAAAALLVVAMAWWQYRAHAQGAPASENMGAATYVSYLQLAGLYALFGAVTAAGIGKVGAYSNYFLELYAGLVWLVALGAIVLPTRPQWQGLIFYILLIISLMYYPPLWDANRLRPAGLIEPSPPRLAVGHYGLWVDAQRQAEVLAAQTRVGVALETIVREAGPILFTDMPGVAASANVTSRLQAFEMRQLLDQELADESALLHELANGSLPLVVLDYLGNWLTPGVVTIVQRRYAHDGSIGTFDLYRPVAAGPAQPVGLDVAVQGQMLHLKSYRLASPAGASYEPGELVALTLDWQYLPGHTADMSLPLTVTVELQTLTGETLLTSQRPLLYGVYPPEAWPSEAVVQHMHPVSLPRILESGRYLLAISLHANEHDAHVAYPIGELAIAAHGGMYVEATAHLIPAPLREAWDALEGSERIGNPLTPAVPFAWGHLQCFEFTCLELRENTVQLRPLGATLYLAETLRSSTCLEGPPTPNGLCPGFSAAPARFMAIGEPVSGELLRNGWLVQWTEGTRLERAPYGEAPDRSPRVPHDLTESTRLERAPDGEVINLGRLGEESLRLPPGMEYRWP